MGMAAGLAFDTIAKDYDARWTSSTVGRLQRAAVWRHIDPLVKPGDRILDLGCGTGEDALHLMQHCGAVVQGVDASVEMIEVAQARGVDARQLTIEAFADLPRNRRRRESGGAVFAGALSNFGALNCVRDLEKVALALGHLIRPGGYLAICVMGARCAWEIGYFLLHGDLTKAFRRWRPNGAPSSLGIRVSYHSLAHLRHAFHPWFRLTRWCGIGLCVPPSYVKPLSASALARLAKIDARVAGWPFLRAIADHRLLLFERL